jgi:IS5 family transposase
LKTPKDGGATTGSVQVLSCGRVKEREDKKPKPIREESFSSKLFFEKNDFGYIDKMVDPNRRRRDGPKGYPPSSIFMALLLMYLKSMQSVLDLIRFLNSNPDWLVTLKLKRRIEGKILYKVPDRSTFYKFANRLGPDKIVQIFSVMVVELMRMRVIKGGKVSLDCSIIRAWFYDCKHGRSPKHNNRKCRHHRHRDKDASWEWDHTREKYVFGYKVHIAIDDLSGLPIMLTVTKAGYGENRTVRWFVRMFLKISIHVEKFLADGAYDAYGTRRLLIKKLKAIPFIALNPRNCKGNTPEEKMERCRKLRYKWHAKNFLKKWWVDPDSETFDKEFDARTFSEQGFSIGKGSLNMNSLKHKGKSWATLHSALICMVMLGVAKTSVKIGRPDLSRCVKCFQS